MNYTFTSNHLLRSICVNLLDHLELRLDFLPFLSYKENRPPPYNKSGSLLYRKYRPLPHRKNLVKADIDIPRVRSSRVQPTVSLTTLLIAPSVAFFYKAFLALLLLDRKDTDLEIVFSHKLAIKQAACF